MAVSQKMNSFCPISVRNAHSAVFLRENLRTRGLLKAFALEEGVRDFFMVVEDILQVGFEENEFSTRGGAIGKPA